MAKLKNIIRQLSEKDYKAVYELLNESSAEKSAYLLKSMREKHLTDNKIMKELDVNTNAYYTLRSRLNQKIEEYLLQQMESPRTDILRKVANINEILFTKKKTIAIATLKKLEKELIDFDLSNELTIVYKALKKLHLNSPEHFNYKQLYNRHVAYMLAVDKAEDLLAEYFKEYGQYILSGDETDKLKLSLLSREMDNVASLYQSHRLYVYQSCLNIFHRLFIQKDDTLDENTESIEDILNNVQNIFESYPSDAIYYHLKLVFEFLKLEYYNHYKVYMNAEKHFEEVNEVAPNLLSNYSLFTYPAKFLLTKVERHLRNNTEDEMYEESKAVFQDFEVDKEDLPKYVTFIVYQAISCYYANHYDEAAQLLNNLLNNVSLKKYPFAQLDIKMLLALQYCMLQDLDLFQQLINSVQRQIRILGKEDCEHANLFAKILKLGMSDLKKNREEKIMTLSRKIRDAKHGPFAPTRLVKTDESFMKKLNETAKIYLAGFSK